MILLHVVTLQLCSLHASGSFQCSVGICVVTSMMKLTGCYSSFVYPFHIQRAIRHEIKSVFRPSDLTTDELPPESLSVVPFLEGFNVCKYKIFSASLLDIGSQTYRISLHADVLTNVPYAQ